VQKTFHYPSWLWHFDIVKGPVQPPLRHNVGGACAALLNRGMLYHFVQLLAISRSP